MTISLRISLVVCAFASWWTCTNADYSPHGDVVILTEKNFEKEVLRSPDYWIVEFYAPWCGHCQKLEPEYKAAAKKLKRKARLGAVDATANAALAQKYKVEGYPTIKEFGKNKKKPTAYRGGRSRMEIIQYVLNSEEAKKIGVSGASVEILDSWSLQAFLTKAQVKNKPVAIFLGSKKAGKKHNKVGPSPPSWIDAVANTFKGSKKKKKPGVLVAFSPFKQYKIPLHFEISDDKLPVVVFVDATGTKFLVSDMEDLKPASATEFITNALAADETAMQSWSDVPEFSTSNAPRKKPQIQLAKLTMASATECLALSGKMCVLLPTVSSLESMEPSMEAKWRSLAKVYRRDPFQFLYTTDEDPSLFAKLASLFHTPDATALVVKPGRQLKYTEFKGESEESSLITFLNKIVEGSTRFLVSELNAAQLTTELQRTDSEPPAAEHEEL